MNKILPANFAGDTFSYRTGEVTIRLRAIFEQAPVIHLEETPLS